MFHYGVPRIFVIVATNPHETELSTVEMTRIASRLFESRHGKNFSLVDESSPEFPHSSAIDPEIRIPGP
jgi:hypothetical protein